MNTPNNAASIRAAGTPYVSTLEIGLLIEVAALAMQDSQQQVAVKKANREYIDSLNEFEAKHGRIEGRLDPKNPDHAEIVTATKPQHEALQREKRIGYNIRRRLQTACRRAPRINAESAS